MATAADINLGNQPSDSAAVQLLIDNFDSQDVVIQIDPKMEIPIHTPAFVTYARACAKLDGAARLLTAQLGPDGPSVYIMSPRESQMRVATAVALEACGPAAVVALPVLDIMLLRRAGPNNEGLTLTAEVADRENILALAIARGLGPDAAPLLPHIVPLLDASSFHVQYWACRAIGGMGDAASDATGALMRVLRDGRAASVRRNACLALGKVAGCSPSFGAAIDLLTEMQDDPTAPVRDAANEALVALGAGGKGPAICPTCNGQGSKCKCEPTLATPVPDTTYRIKVEHH